RRSPARDPDLERALTRAPSSASRLAMTPDPQSAPPARVTRREAGATLLLFIALSVAWTWPLAARLDEPMLSNTPTPPLLVHGDFRLTSWIVTWGAHALRTHPLHVFDANIFYPLRNALAFSEHMLAGALLVLPFDLLHHNAIANNNLLILASFALGGT